MKQESIILGQNTPYPLKGILTIPDGHGPFPAISANIAQAKKEFSKERHIGPQVLDDLANWINAQ